MGDRGNIVIRQGKTSADDVWFYTHWAGSEINQTVKTALARRRRWNDDSYLARIVFDTLTAGSQGEETGFGISCSMQDNEHDIVVVDVPNQTVCTISEGSLVGGRLPDTLPKGKSFEDFIA